MSSAGATSTCGPLPSVRSEAAGVEEVEHVELCTACHPELLFSHRRTGEPRGVQGVIARVA